MIKGYFAIYMLNKSFVTSFFALALVFSALLGSRIILMYKGSGQKPQIVSCLLFEGNSKALLDQIHQESEYVDQFVILQSSDVLPLKEEMKSQLMRKKNVEITIITLALGEETSRNKAWEGFIKAKELNVFENCKDEDIILISKQGQKVDFPTLYKSFSSMTKKKSYLLQFDSNEHKSVVESTIQAALYGFLKGPFVEKKPMITSAKKNFFKRRRLFFQTSAPLLMDN